MKFPVALILFVAASPPFCLGQHKASAPTNSSTIEKTPGTTAAVPSTVPTSAQLLTSLLQATTPELVFRPDDVISVQVYGLKDYALHQQVAQDGTVPLPFLGKVRAAGLTVAQLETRVEAELRRGGIIVHDPQVVITAISRPSAVVTVSGDVVKPGTFPAYGELTLMDYLSDAGGLPENISGNSVVNSPASLTVTLIRPSLGHPVKIPLGPDPASSEYGRIPLFPGDQVQVSPVGMVYAVGAFKTQGAYPLKNSSPTTILQLAAMAGGIGYEAKPRKAYIIRSHGDKRYILDINLAEIQSGKESDVALQANDVLLLPTNAMRAALKNGGAGIIAVLASAFIYTHP